MKRIPKSALVALPLAVCATVILCSTAVRGSSAAQSSELVNETPKMWFVEYPSAPLADGTRESDVDQDDQSFRSEAAAKGVSYKARMRFKSLWNGVSIEARPSEMAKIRKLGSVKAVFPVQTHALPKTTQVSPDLATAIELTGAKVAQNELGLSGKGVRVAVMDTGIDYQNPDLGGAFGKHARVTTGWDFVGDDYDADSASPTYQPVPHPDADPDDCNGHGTHVAGIIGAKGDTTKGGVIGVAPGVTFGAYRVFGCEGSTSDDVMIAAMERILKDKMDVLNMSIGDAFNNWPGAPTAAAADRLVRKGVVVVASIGNSGTSGLWSAGAPGVGDRVIGVASFDNIRSTNPAFSYDGKLVGFDQAAAAAIAPRSGTATLTRIGTPTTANDGCAASPAGSFTGKTVLIRRGACGFFVKALNAQNAGAAGVILYNNAAGRVSPTVAGATPITIPVVAITRDDGARLYAGIVEGKTSMTWTEQVVVEAIATGNRISSFSSYGLAADLSLKPDIGAPGGFIWSTLPLEQGGHGSLSGTSMSSPHVAGGVALLLEARGILRSHGNSDDDGNDESWRSSNEDERNLSRASLVRDVLQNSAVPQTYAGAPAGALLDNVQRQGAGMLNIVGAVQATSFLYPGKLSLGEGTGPVTKSLMLFNAGKSSVTYTFGHEPARSNGPEIFVPTFSDASAKASFSVASVTLRSGETRAINVTITPGADLKDRSIYGGYIVANPSSGEAIRVPYVGFYGDYQSIQILNETILGGSPLLLDGNLDDVDLAAHAFTLKEADVPTVVFHMDLQARQLAIEVIDAAGKTLGRAIDIDYMPRNASRTGFFALSWDGTYRPGVSGTAVLTAPDGKYTLRLTAEKPLAEKNNPAHVEEWRSAVIAIDRP